ncbi:hypothetical protein P3342_007325 [Pyrenophora teres f. teres]|nr:hypothetical protein P3342_007325 [Pyrenophora teres f. teres]
MGNKTFHVDKLRPAANDPLPSQQTDDSNPAAIVVRDQDEDEDHLECIVHSITDERIRNGETQYFISWEGYDEGSWEPAAYVKDVKALDDWLTQTTTVRGPNGRLKKGWRRTLLKEQRRSSRASQDRTILLRAATTATGAALGGRTSSGRKPSLGRTARAMVLPNAVRTGTPPTPLGQRRNQRTQ